MTPQEKAAHYAQVAKEREQMARELWPEFAEFVAEMRKWFGDCRAVWKRRPE